MDSPKQIIAVCTTKIQSQDRIAFIEGLYNRLDKNRYKIIVFNSPSDFYENAPSDIGAVASYDIINFDRIGCLIIDKMHFQSDDVFNGIVDRAKKKAVPVIVLNAQIEGCFCILPDYDNAYEELLTHLISVHNYRDFFFIGGIKGEQESERRLDIFRNVLHKNGIDLSSENIAYGLYFEALVYDIFDELYEKNKLPQVFVCANDTMALAIYQKAKEHGLRIPEDIAVTGFDGLQYSSFMTPPLATCQKNDDGLISAVKSVIEGISDQTLSPGNFFNSYRAVARGSCGCKSEAFPLTNDVVLSTFRGVERSFFYEDRSYNVIEKAIDFDCQRNIYEILMECSVPNSSICIKGDYSTTMNNFADSEKGFSDKFYVLSHQSGVNSSKDALRVYRFEDMVPYFDEWLNDDTLYMVTAIHAGDSVCGHYAIKTRVIRDTIYRFNRTGRTINIIMTEALSRYKQRNISFENAKALNIDPISGLPNIKSLSNWFKSFSSVRENHRKTVMVSLYWVPKYKEIYEQFGIDELDKIITYISETLKIANPQNSFVSQIAEDEFIVINYVDDVKDVSGTINNATNVFFGLRENFDREMRQQYGEDFELEINCGCTVVDKDWSDTIKLSSLIKLARTEMFANRFKYSTNAGTKSSRSAREDYNALLLLINRNRFIYHYQPIIDIKDKSIFAYEALMRTDEEINMSPLDILATADSYQRMYDIERATIFNVMEQYSAEADTKFHRRKVFINSIPGYFLNSMDREEIKSKYSDYFDSFVFEITEGDVASDEEVNLIRTLGDNEFGIPIAIDDYGSGCSNIVNLLRYAPQIIKVDRYLITDIDKDANKQMFMKGTIEFASANNIKVLAEGVETCEEFRTVVSLGVDFVQGYYTGRPALLPMTDIPDYVVSDIEAAMPQFA